MLYFKLKKTAKMNKVFKYYARRKGVQARALRFIHDGRSISKELTPEENGLKHDDILDVMFYQEGGFTW